MHTTNNTSRALAPRRGSVLIFALAILAVLALLGATYVTRANLDRVSAEAAVRRSTLADQPDIVIQHARALLTADLFGNKIVTKSTPATIDPQSVEAVVGGAAFTSGPNTIDVWPAMFEDGEHWDYPSVDEIDYDRATSGADRYSFARAVTDDDNVLDNPVRNEARLRFDTTIGMFETARPDDAWLAATEPVDHTGAEAIGSYAGGWDTWPQITNPRSAYRWTADPDNDADNNDLGAWVRDDGRFADLARFFNTPNAIDRERGDPAADLLDRDNLQQPFYNPADTTSVLALSEDYNSALLGVEQRRIYGLQMNQLAEWYELGASFNADMDDAPFEPVDERFWADTDGDGRPDARWTVLDELDGQGDMRWVVAMRIADSSAAVNVNTSLEAIPPVTAPFQPYEVYGDGATPMDVDLVKLFTETADQNARDSSAYAASADLLRHPDVRGLIETDIRTGLRRHLRSGLGFDEDLVEGTSVGDSTMESFFDNPDYAGVRDFIAWDSRDDNFAYPGNDITDFPTTRAQREAYWRLFASRPNSPLVRGGRRYDLKEEVELRASLGANFPGVKAIESNFDGAYIPGDSRLPGALSDAYPDQNSLGPMRSAESGNAVSRDDLMSVTLPAFNNAPYSQQQRIERIQKDVRRSLTVASGASARSVVPAIGQREVNPGRLKPQVNAGAWNGTQFSSTLDIADAFEAFTWALAPLATNKPLMGAFTANGNWASDYDTLFSTSAGFHYGGGANGPAQQWESDLAISTSGPTYALFRAASMAVNLKDAVDNEGANPTPTVARLFTAPEPTTLPPDDQLVGSTILTTRFAHGDIDDADNPNGSGANIIPTTLTQPQNGITFVGLDRQPFISEVFTLCMYKVEINAGFAAPPPPDPVVFSDADIVDGRAVVVFEVINPWGTPLDLSPYRLALSDGANYLELDPQSIIDPGERAAVVWHNADAGFEVEGDNARLDDALADLVSTVEFLTGNDPVGEVDPFGGWDRTQVSALLFLADTPTTGAQVLVDRLHNASGADFPATNADATLTQASVLGPVSADPGDDSGAYFSVASNLTRSSARNADGGFTNLVIESAENNAVNVAAATDGAGAEGWHSFETNLVTRDHFALMDNDEPAGWAAAFTIGEDKAGGLAALSVPFSLFVPDSPLIAASELGQICTFAHTYFHTGTTAPTVTAADAVPGSSDWTTVSEQLGKDYHLSYNAGGTATDNPYLGVLDPTRYILGTEGDLGTVIPNLPDAMAVPLALRVYDAFEVLGDRAMRNSDTLVEGRININTAPKRVLATLPLVLPVDYNLGAIPTSLDDLDKMNAYARLNAMMQYRERLGSLWTDIDDEIDWGDWHTDPRSQPDALTQLIGLRTLYDSTATRVAAGIDANQHRKGRGFSSLGELSILTRWSAGAGAPTPGANVESGFLELADDNADNEVNSANTRRNALDVRPAENLDISDEATDDVEERLALFRAVSNIATTRSDVYHAWYIARAYSPAAIEGVEVDPALSTIDDRAELLNELPVAFEERGFLVLDRSNVKEPTDRPRILLRVVLDSTTAAN